MGTTHGTAWTDTAHTYIKGLLTELITDLSDDTPKIGYVYDRHVTALLLLNAATLELISIEPSEDDQYNGRLYLLTYSIRVHTGYGDDPIDGLTTARLCNSVVNKINANFDTAVAAGLILHTLGTVRPAARFTESDSVGGEVEVKYIYEHSITQES